MNQKAIETYAVHLYKARKPWSDPYAYYIEYTGNYYGEDFDGTRIYNWQEYEQESSDAVDYWSGESK